MTEVLGSKKLLLIMLTFDRDTRCIFDVMSKVMMKDDTPVVCVDLVYLVML